MLAAASPWPREPARNPDDDRVNPAPAAGPRRRRAPALRETGCPSSAGIWTPSSGNALPDGAPSTHQVRYASPARHSRGAPPCSGTASPRRRRTASSTVASPSAGSRRPLVAGVPRSGAPLPLMGHGGGLHKRAPGLVARARQAVAGDGFHVAAIDVPGHGDRKRSQQDQWWVNEMIRAREAGQPLGTILAPFNSSLVERAVPEWRRTIDALQSLPAIGAEAPIGYSGMTIANAIGISLAAADPRIRAAIFGGVFVHDAVLEAARRVTIPIQLLLPWDDPEIDRESDLALFDAFGSQEKTLPAFQGWHFTLPADRIDTRFFARRLGGPALAGAATSSVRQISSRRRL